MAGKAEAGDEESVDGEISGLGRAKLTEARGVASGMPDPGRNEPRRLTLAAEKLKRCVIGPLKLLVFEGMMVPGEDVATEDWARVEDDEEEEEEADEEEAEEELIDCVVVFTK